jgi:saccharopine dehydrogenase-like NADP-dependent oxidoreductase
MRICIVGCGNQGTGLAGLLAQETDIEEIILVDSDIDRAKTAMGLVKSLGQKLKTKSIRVAEADALDSDEVACVANGTDLIFNGIYATYNTSLMQACLDVGAHYIDLRSNAVEGPGVPWNETIDAQLKMDEKFKLAGLTAVPCMGVSPGWANMMACYMIDQMDTIDSVICRNIDWIDSTDLLAPIAPRNVFYLWLGPPYPTCMVNGLPQKVELLESEEEFEFPAPAGKQKVYTFTQDPDIVLISKFANKPIPYIEGKMAICMGGLEMKDVWLKAISEQTAKHTGSDNMFDLFGKSLIYNTNFRQLCEEGILKDGILSCTVEVTGKKDGTTVRHTAYHSTTMTEAMKHIPWAGHNVYGTIGGMVVELVLMLCRGEYKERGVINVAEMAKDKDLWYKKLANRGHMLTEKVVKGTDLL